MRKFDDLVGKRFGRLTVVARAERRGRYVYWLCKCDCGNTKLVQASHLAGGGVRSCGCLKRELHTKHGHHDDRIYSIWEGMYGRCYNPNQLAYRNYGGRGISICDEWRGENGFVSFYNWAMSNGYSDSLTIDRIDSNGNYEPSNCRWATRKEQNNNLRSNIHITIDGETRTISQWSEVSGLNRWIIYYRFRRGFTGRDLIEPKTDRGAKAN